MAKTHRTPTGTDQLKADIARLNAEGAGRRRDRLADPADSNHFDPAIAPDPDDEIIVVTTDTLTAAASPRGGTQADPPAAPTASVAAVEPSASSPSAGSGGGSGRSQTGRSIGTVIANTAMDAALGVPVDLQDEMAHVREAVHILVEVTANYHSARPGYPAELMPVGKLLDLEAVVLHMVQARGLGGTR